MTKRRLFLLFFLALIFIYLVQPKSVLGPSSDRNENAVKSTGYNLNKVEKSNLKLAQLNQQSSVQARMGQEELGSEQLQADLEFNQALSDLQTELQKDSITATGKGTDLDLNQNEQADLVKNQFNQKTLPVGINPSSTNPEIFELTPSEIEALNNSGKNNANSNLIGGVHNRKLVKETDTADELDVVQTTAEAFQELPQLTGQPRGYVMLYLMHPNAKETVNAQIEGLVVSGIRNLYLGVLIDGTFGKDLEFLKNNIKKLSDNSDSLTLVLYLSNGATMRRWNQTDIVAGFNTIEPKVFRELIKFEDRAKNEFRAIVRDAEEIFNYNLNLSLANKNIAIVMLEDNLQKDSYLAMRNLARDILGDRAEYFRNPCPGCYPGNDIETDGDPIEIHDPEGVYNLQAGQGFTNDGVSYRFPEESTRSNNILIDDLEDRMLVADTRGARYFGLWRTERQGYSIPPIHPDKRVYEVPTVKQLVRELSMLRSGLKPIK